MSKTNTKGKAQSKTKVAFWFETRLAGLLDEIAEKYGITRSAFIRLIMRETLVNRGFLERETGSLLPKAEGV